MEYSRTDYERVASLRERAMREKKADVRQIGNILF